MLTFGKQSTKEKKYARHKEAIKSQHFIQICAKSESLSNAVPEVLLIKHKHKTCNELRHSRNEQKNCLPEQRNLVQILAKARNLHNFSDYVQMLAVISG